MNSRLIIILCISCSAVWADKASKIRSATAELQKEGARIRRTADGSLELDFHLRGRKISAATLAVVTQLPRVTALNLRDTRVTNEMLSLVARLPELRRLHLERTQIGDAGIARLTGLQHLKYLNLYQTKITDGAVPHLIRIDSLRSLYVWDSGVSQQGLQNLKAGLPETKVVGGVDLASMPAEAPQRAVDRPKQQLTWMPFSGELPPRSILGTNTRIVFENRSNRKVRVYWVSYNNELVLYATLKPGATRDQNTFSDASWLITDLDDEPLGWFRTGEPKGLAVIPGK